MDRLTDTNTNKVCFDTWELCGLDNVCKRDCWKPAPCKLPKMIRRLAAYEDTGLTPEEVALYVKCEAQRVSKRELELAAENERLRAQLEQAEDTYLTLDELRQMDGEPVWIEDIEQPKSSAWRLCHMDRGKYLVLQGIESRGYLKDEYGETWLAYSRKPKEEVNGVD